ncbi:hypothetical protein [Limnohabitans sp.]|uniref:hypothetical protein n=1 Tax=Limnohabitans sp. TaxID=1907725 RepID=UPI00286EF072|nr:hypothetical protein [Limnohabitans sp.]
MDEVQRQINQNVQERLRSLEASQQVLTAFLVALIETHPNRESLKRQFVFHAETLHATSLSKALPEDWIDSAAAFQQLLVSSFDRPSK